MLRPLWRPYGVKDRALRLDLMKHERNSMGIPVGWVDEDGFGSDEMDAVLASMAAGRTRTSGSRGGRTSGSRGVEGQASSPLDLVKFCNEEMGRALLAMVSRPRQTGSGTLTSADVHDGYLRMFHDVVWTRSGDQLSQQMIGRWVQWNFADPDAPVARIGWAREGDAVEEQTYAYYLEYKLLTIDEARAPDRPRPAPGWRRRGVPGELRGPGPHRARRRPGRRRRVQPGSPTARPQACQRADLPHGFGRDGGQPGARGGIGTTRPGSPADRSRRPVTAAADVPLPDRELRRQAQAFEASPLGADFQQIDTDWQSVLDTVAAELTAGRATLADALLAAIRNMRAVDPLTLADELAPILRATADEQDTGPLADALERAAREGVDQVVAEADRQGESISPPDLDYRERRSWKRPTRCADSAPPSNT